MSIASPLTTAADLFRMPSDGYRYELIEGELRKMTPAGFEHGFIISEVHGRLWTFVGGQKLGVVTGAETGFLISKNPDTVLAPDVAFVRAARVEAVGVPKAFFPEAPALVVEVISPSDKAEDVDDKMRRWIAAGVELGWLVYPRSRTVNVYSSLSDIRVLGSADTLDGGTVVPGFSCSIAELFTQLPE